MDTAVVLGGGGLTAYAWQVGMLAGLAETGVDLGDADLFGGTSAGALLAAELASGARPADLYRVQVGRERAMLEVTFTWMMTAKYLWAVLGSRDRMSARKRLGKLALSVRDVPESAVFDAIGPQLPVRDWPEKELRLFAVDVLTGEATGFSAHSGISLVRAMSASCALPPLFPPITVGRSRWMDGGARSTTNADLVEGCRTVLVLAPIPKAPGTVPGSEEVASLRGAGVRASLLVPDRASRRAFGRNPLDASRIPDAARAGYRQGGECAGGVRAFWEG
ncbi:patatin-like phospholipase family protein [Streptomyces sp. NPDC091279]|uniref:patatin-like phospholipase family protein n=1 Tax=unclassified Streptomyces TaxID=2593676 RepID=UPI0038079EFE